MALSDAEIKVLYADETGFILDDSPAALLDFARVIEAEVRNQDAALILMLVERLERADKISGHANNKAAITAGRAWLEGTHEHRTNQS